MSPASRATGMPVALYRTAGPAGKSGSKLRRAGEISLTTPGLDLATKLRVFQRALRSRDERAGAMLGGRVVGSLRAVVGARRSRTDARDGTGGVRHRELGDDPRAGIPQR